MLDLVDGLWGLGSLMFWVWFWFCVCRVMVPVGASIVVH